MNARLAPSYNAAEAWIYEAYEKDLWEGWSESFEAERLYEEAQSPYQIRPLRHCRKDASFNSRLRNELLDAKVFESESVAHSLAAERGNAYNRHHPDSLAVWEAGAN